MSDPFTDALIGLGLTDDEAVSFIKGVDDYFLSISREAWSIDLQLSEAQRRHTEMQPKLTTSQSIAAKLSRPWPDPAPSAPPPVPVAPVVLVTSNMPTDPIAPTPPNPV